MPGLDQLRELYAWMRSERVLYARCGELELRLDPVPPQSSVSSAEAAPDTDTEDDERRSLEDLLYSSGAEAEPFLRMMRRAG